MSEKNNVDDLVVKVFGASDIGKLRHENQDSFYLDGKYLHKFQANDSYKLVERATTPQLYAVFDGLGGEEGGAVSSKIACETMKEFQRQLTTCKPEDLYQTFCEYATTANERICKELGSVFYPKGGTTFVAILITNGVFYPFYLGDSRIYLAFEDSLYMISDDHTVAAQKVREGKMTEQEAMMSQENHMLTNFLGDQPGADEVKVAMNNGFKLENGMTVLLCSDGLHDYVHPTDVFRIIKESPDPAIDLVNRANENGGYDNVTPVVIRFVKE